MAPQGRLEGPEAPEMVFVSNFKPNKGLDFFLLSDAPEFRLFWKLFPNAVDWHYNQVLHMRQFGPSTILLLTQF